MPGGVTTAVGFPSGVSGRCGRFGGMRQLVADIGSSGIGRGSHNSSWDETLKFVDGSVDGAPRNGAHFNSARDRVKQRWIISGQTLDASSAALPGATVTLFTTVDNMPRATTVSDASGNYVFTVDGNCQTRFCVSYLAGSPDVAGTTVNSLVPVLT